MYESLARNLLSIDFRGEKFRVIHRFETFEISRRDNSIFAISPPLHIRLYFFRPQDGFSVSEKSVIIVETLIDEYSR